MRRSGCGFRDPRRVRGSGRFSHPMWDRCENGRCGRVLRSSLELSRLGSASSWRFSSIATVPMWSAMSRLGGWRARRVLKAAGATIKSVVNGVLGTALVQGILLGFSFWVAGVPGAIVLGAVGVVLSLVPMGLLLLWLPAGLWLMSDGHTGWAVFVMVWNALFVGNLDSVLRPYLISRGIRMPMVLIFLGVLGGLLTFGI